MDTPVSLLSLALCLLLAGAGRVDAAPPPDVKRVVLLEQFGLNRPVRARFDTAFIEAMRGDDEVPFELYQEVLDTDRFPGPEHAQHVADYLRGRYANRDIDVVVAFGNAALAFARQHAALFGTPAIVGIAMEPGTLAGDNVTGLQGALGIRETLDLALTLLPDTRHVFVVNSALDTDADIEAEVTRQFDTRGGRPQLEYLRDSALDDLVTRVATLPEQSIVLFLRQSLRDASNGVDPFSGFLRVFRASAAPVFSISAAHIGRGAVGGFVWHIEEDVQRIAQMVKRIAAGTSPREMTAGHFTMQATLDWRELERWNIPLARVPAGSNIRFRPESFFERYRRYVAAGLVIFTAQFALIVGLLVQRARRHRAEHALRENESRYRSVVDTQSELICRFLPDTTLTFVNDAYCRYFRKSRAELLGRRFIELIPPAAQPAVLEMMSGLKQGSTSHEHQVTLPDGTVGWHHWVNQAIVGDRGELLELQGVGRDITDRKRAEEAIGRLEARTSALLRAIPDLMFLLRRDGTYLDYHVRDSKLLYVAPEQFIGKRIRDVLPPAAAEVLMDAIERACRDEEMVVVEYVLHMEEPRYYEARLVYAGEDRVLTIVRDVSEAKQAAQLNRNLVGRLITAQEAERSWIARELHDGVLQDLAAVSVDLSHIRQKGAELPAGEAQQLLQALQRRMASVAENLRLLSHGLHPSVLHHLGLVAALQSHCAEIERTRHIRVNVFADRDDEPSSRAVSLSLFRIAQESLRNTAQHASARHVTVSLVREATDLTLSISDDGRGFDAAAARRNGGLGLVSIEERARLVHGSVSIESTPGGGTRIDVRIPVEMADRADGPRTADSRVVRPSTEGPWLSAE